MITAEQKSRRHTYIGGSDVPIIMGKSKFKSPWELLLEKAQVKESDFGGNIYSHVGTVLEPRIQDALNILNVDEVNYEKEFANVKFECHVDGLDKNEEMFYEIKVASQNINQCYDAYEWQIRTYMYATGIKKCKLVLLNRNECSGGYLKKCINYTIKYYNIDYIHDFNKVNNCEDIICDINVGLDHLKIDKKEFKIKEVTHDELKEQYMLEKVSKFWQYKNELENNKELVNNNEFRNSFLKEFR